MPAPARAADPTLDERPALLVALGPSFDKFQQARASLAFRDYALDSGAFTAMTEGRPVRVEDFIARVRDLRASDPQLVEVFALDVIGDAAASMVNYRAIERAGIDAIPTYHYGEPWEVLDELARSYPKVAIGGVARRLSQREEWAERCLQRVWPKRVHGFGYSAPSLARLPFHSIDASTWAYASKGFGKYLSMRSKQLSIRGRPNIRVEVEHNLRLERQARGLQRRRMEELNAAGEAPVVRLVFSTGCAVERAALMRDRGAAARLLRPEVPDVER